MGHWPAAPNGKHHLPEFHVGQTVLVAKHGGQQLHRDFGGKFKLVKQSAVMAVVSEQ
jgi:co-chaperonin GroES (HSP10)